MHPRAPRTHISRRRFLAGASSVGAAVASALTARLGPGPTIILGQLVLAAGTAVLASASALPAAAAPVVALGQALFGAARAELDLNRLEEARRDYEAFIRIAPPGYAKQVAAAREVIGRLQNR